ncbi:MAG: hypothetical protein FJ090_16900 [Deltaproteobacteria bacterium]|nr:hypothetical protein [Deltaproteobacteria bacterium]
MRLILALLVLAGCNAAKPDPSQAACTEAQTCDTEPVDSGHDSQPTQDSTSDATPTDSAPLDTGHTGEPCPSASVNAAFVGGTLMRLYPTPDGAGATFSLAGELLTSTRADGSTRWTASPGVGALLGGFDVDADGWTDAAVVTSTPLGTTCGSTAMSATGLTFVSGADGALISGVAPLDDLCWDFGGVQYPTSQWTVDGVLFGAAPGVIALSPYYASNSWFFTWSGAFSSEYLYYPSTATYDSAYTADQLNQWGTGTSYLANSHIANGLLLETGGELRWVFFTSGRVVHYAVEAYSDAQLRLDVPFLSNARTDIAGRNYGIVARDPGDPNLLVLVTGTDGASLLADARAGAAVTDPWGGIERHVTVHNLVSGTVEDRFFSYAHDNADGDQYVNRTAYPAAPFVRTAGASALAFSVFDGTTWSIHVTAPGTTTDAAIYSGWYLWDIRDIDTDGVDEWVVSPTAGYLPMWQTQLWHEGGEPVATFDGLPALIAGFRAPETTTTAGYLYPALTVEGACGPALVLINSDGAYVLGE